MEEATEYHSSAKPELHVILDGFEGPLDLLLTLAKSCLLYTSDAADDMQ